MSRARCAMTFFHFTGSSRVVVESSGLEPNHNLAEPTVNFQANHDVPMVGTTVQHKGPINVIMSNPV